MRAAPFDTGVVTISVDTELGWARINSGRYDDVADRLEEGRTGIVRLLELFERYDVPATWAVVGQLCRSGPGEQRDGPREAVAPDDADVPWDRDWWHARDLVRRIVDAPVDHEVGAHSGSHLLFDDCPAARARADLEDFREWCDLVDRADVRSFVYPQNRVGHRQVLAEAGFTCYRGPPPRLGAGPTPTVVLPRREEHLVKVPASVAYRHYGGRNAVLRALPTRAKVAGLRAGLEHAALRGRVFHVVLHPNDFTLADGKRLLAGLDRWLEYVDRRRAAGAVDLLTMGGVADRATFDGERQ